MHRTSARFVHRVGRTDDGIPRVLASVATRSASGVGAAGLGPRWFIGLEDGHRVQVGVTRDGELSEIAVTAVEAPLVAGGLQVTSRSAGLPVLNIDGWAPGGGVFSEPVTVALHRIPSGELEVQLGAAGPGELRAIWVGGNLQLLVEDGGRIVALRVGPLHGSEWDALS